MSNEIRAVGQPRALPISDENSLIDITIPAPTPGPNDLLVAVRAVSVNPVDYKVRGGQEPPVSPRVLGYDAAGTIQEVGSDVTLFAPGDTVYYSGDINRQGSNAELQAVDWRLAAKAPSSLTLEEAAALPLTTLTAWEGLFDKLKLTETSSGILLVAGGAGGVGSIVIQLVKALAPKVRVVATASRPETQQWVRDMGADDVVDHHGDVAEQLRDIAPDGVDWIYTTNSQGQLPLYQRILKVQGEVVAIDDYQELDIAFYKGKSLSWHWENIFARSQRQTPDMVRQHEILTRVAELIDNGKIRTTLTKTLRPIDAATLRQAHELVESGTTIGKIVVTNGEG